MNQRERNSLDRYITGNYGMDQFQDEIPEEFWCTECDGDNKECPMCKGTGYQQEKLQAAQKEWEAQAKAEASAEYEAYLESLRNPLEEC